MAVYYVDMVSGNDGTGTGTAGAPWKTLEKANLGSGTGDTIRIAKTGTHTTVTPAASITFTEGSATATAPADITASLAVADWIALTTATGNGNFSTFYRINVIVFSLGVTTITLAVKYAKTTTTEASVLKCVFATDTGNSTVFTTATMAPNNKNLTISGGWNLSGTPAQDGETWFKGSPAARTTAWKIFQPYGSSNLTISNINLIETNTMAVTYAANTFNNCTMHTYGAPFASSTVTAAISANYYNLAISAETGSYIYLTTGTGTWNITNIQTSGATTQHFYQNGTAPVKMNFNGCVCVGATYAVSTGVSGSKFTLNDMVLKYNTYAVTALTSDALIDATNATLKNNTYGVYFSVAGTRDYVVKNGTFSNNTADVFISRSYGINIQGITSTNSAYSVYFSDEYSRDILVTSCSFTTPTNYAVYTAGTMNSVKIINCTIDAPSNAKLFPLVTLATVTVPQFIIDNCTNVASGLYYGYQSLTKSTVTFRTQAPSIQFQTKLTLVGIMVPLKLWSTWGAASTGYTLSFWINSNNGWAGELDIIIRVAGKDVIINPTITSLANVWTQYTFNITSGMMTADGEISVNVINNPNAVAIFFDDFTIV